MKFIENIYTESLLLSKSLTVSSLWQGCSLVSFVAILFNAFFSTKKEKKKKLYSKQKTMHFLFDPGYIQSF